MKLVEYKCKNCGAKLKINPEVKDVTCQMCGSTFHIDDETVHHEHVHKIADPEETAYKATRGAIRAQQDSTPKIFIVFFVIVAIFVFSMAIFTVVQGISFHKEWEQTESKIKAADDDFEKHRANAEKLEQELMESF